MRAADNVCGTCVLLRPRFGEERGARESMREVGRGAAGTCGGLPAGGVDSYGSSNVVCTRRPGMACCRCQRVQPATHMFPGPGHRPGSGCGCGGRRRVASNGAHRAALQLADEPQIHVHDARSPPARSSSSGERSRVRGCGTAGPWALLPCLTAMGDRQDGFPPCGALLNSMHEACGSCSAGCGRQNELGACSMGDHTSRKYSLSCTGLTAAAGRRPTQLARCGAQALGNAAGVRPMPPMHCGAPHPRGSAYAWCCTGHAPTVERARLSCRCSRPGERALCSACGAAFRGRLQGPPAAAAAATAMLLPCCRSRAAALPPYAGLGRWRAPTRSAAATWRAWRR